MSSVLIRNLTDSWVNENRPNKNYSNTARFRIQTNGADGKFAFLFFGKPFPLGATITRAKLRLYTAKAATGTYTLNAERVSEKFSMSRVTWTNKPTAGGTNYELTKTDPGEDELWEIDILGMLQYVANGGAWYGIRIKSTTDAPLIFHSAQSNQSEYRPSVEIEWADNPDQPEDLNPRNNLAISVAKPVLTTDFVDVSGDVGLDAMNVQISATADFVNIANYWDSGWVTTTVPQLDLATTTYPGLAAGASTWWRVRVRDGAGLESSWSEPVQMRRVDHAVVTMVNPAPLSPVINDVTPPISWTFSGIQTAYRILIYDPNDPTDVKWNSGKISSADQTVTVPAGKIENITDELEVAVRVWDDVERQAEGGRAAYTYATQRFTFQKKATVTPVTNLVATPDYPYPWVNLTWDRTSMPDSYTIIMDGKVLETDIMPEDVFVSGTSYAWRAKRVPARVPHTFEVLSVQNGESSANNPTANVTTKPNMTWLTRPNGTNPICIVKSGSEPGPVVDAQNSGFQETHQPVGGGAPVLITQFMRGFEGHVEGVLSDGIVQGLTAREMRDRFKEFKREVGNRFLLYMVDETMEIVMFNMTYRPRAKSGGTILYDISFDFFEV